MVERDSEPLAATVFDDQRAVVMRRLAKDDRVALLAILKTGAAEAPVSCPIMCDIHRSPVAVQHDRPSMAVGSIPMVNIPIERALVL